MALGNVFAMMTRRLTLIALGEIVLVVFGVYGYSMVYGSGQNISAAGTEPIVTLTGVGATLAYPLLSAAYSQYDDAHPGVRISFNPIGSEAGISQFLLQTVDFSATYPPMTVSQRNHAPGIPLHIPESISGVVVAYNLQGIQGSLRLDGKTTANIFLGTIQYWDDQQITSMNPSLDLPHNRIQTIHMAEAEGTTFVFTSYLASVSNDFRQSLNFGTTVAWTTGVSVPTDSGVASLMTTTPNSIGYMELSYALQTKLTYASILNSAGNYIVPSEGSVRAAEEAFASALPSGDGDWSSINLLNEPGGYAYPLVTFTYILVYQNLSNQRGMDLAKATALVDFLGYLIHDGQSLGPPLGYVPLPQNVVNLDEASLKSITFQGKTLIQS